MSSAPRFVHTLRSTPTLLSSRDTSCNGSICCDPMCLPAQARRRNRLRQIITCKNKVNYACVGMGWSMQCIEKGVPLQLKYQHLVLPHLRPQLRHSQHPNQEPILLCLHEVTSSITSESPTLEASLCDEDYKESSVLKIL